MSARLKIFTFYAQPFGRRGPSYTCAEILDNVVNDEVEAVVYAARNNGAPEPAFEIVPAIPRKPFPYKPFAKASLRLSSTRFLRDVARADPDAALAYVWPGAPPQLLTELRARGVPVVREMINTFDGYGDPIVASAYRAIGGRRRGPVRAKGIDADRAVLALADHVVANNEHVEVSLAYAGVPAEKLIRSSYGWNPQRMSGANRALPPIDGVTFVCVGDVSVHKGSHLLLDYWRRAKVAGRLVLAGHVEPIVRRSFADVLSRPDVLALGYVADVGAVYRSADAFLFPSLDEGGPQVTYEAAGCGLPLLVSPMGAGRIARDGVNGFVREPTDAEGWIAAIRALAADVGLRRAMGAAAAADARKFTWERVGARRRQQFLDILDRRRAARRGAPQTPDLPAPP